MDPVIERVLEHRTWAVVGCSPWPERPSHRVANFLRNRGYRVICVNPNCDVMFDGPCYAALADIPEPVDVVDVFRRSEFAGAHVDEAIAIGAKAVWLQLGVIDDEAAVRAGAAGLDVVMDRCPAIELPKLAAAGGRRAL